MNQTRVLFNPGVAALLSLVFPGAGQIYKGQIFNGLAWLGIVVLGYLFFVVPGLVLHLACIVGAASGKNTVVDVDPDAPTPETHGRCSDCKEWVRRDAIKCKHCGSLFTSPTSQAQ